MIPGIFEKLGHTAGVAVLYGRGQLPFHDAMAAGPDLLLGALFLMAFTVTPRSGGTVQDRMPAMASEVRRQGLDC
jgi:hypothetical protein